MQITNPAIPLDSIVVVIGANGYIGLETCEKLLEAGFRVRGTVRDVEKNSSWMHALFDKRWPGKFELVKVEDFTVKGAFDEAFKGASAVIYVSVPIIIDTNPANNIYPIVTGTLNTLEAAAKAGVKRYTLAASSKGVETTVYNKPHHLTTKMFNHDAILQASCGTMKAEDFIGRALTVYSAGRALSEIAFWSWVEENKPPFVANCLVLDGQFGRVMDKEHTNSTAAMLKSCADGRWDSVVGDLAYVTDVQDSARLFVATVALPSIQNERLFAYCRHNMSWNDLRQVLREIDPTLVSGEDLAVDGRDLSDASEAIGRAEEVLKMVKGEGFSSVDSIFRDWVRTYVQ